MRGIILACNLSAISFVISLRIVFSREIGLKSLGEMGLLLFGMSVMKELLIACKLNFPEKKSLHI
jgi:hypothetical protein